MSNKSAKDWLNEQHPDNIVNYLGTGLGFDDAYIKWYNANPSHKNSFGAGTIYKIIMAKPAIQRYYMDLMFNLSRMFKLGKKR